MLQDLRHMKNVVLLKNSFHKRHGPYSCFSSVWFNSSSQKMISMLSWTKLVLYRPFCDFHNDIGYTSDDIIQNWEKFRYNPWHVDHNQNPPEERVDLEEEEELIVQRDSQMQEWEII